VIVSQCNGWNDTVRMAMYIELVLGGAVAKRVAGGPLLLWMDNFSAHRNEDIDALLTTCNVYPAMYPENMTAYLQVLDLVVNGPIKRHIRASRSRELLDKFHVLKVEYNRSVALGAPMKINWQVPRTSAKTCILNLLTLFAKDFKDPAFKLSIANSFMSTGSFRNAQGGFEVYTESSSLGELPMSTQKADFDVMAMILDQEEEDDELHAILDRIDLNSENGGGEDNEEDDEEDDDNVDDSSEEDEVGEVVVARARSSRNCSILFPF
jgi:hypothetical protein